MPWVFQSATRASIHSQMLSQEKHPTSMLSKSKTPDTTPISQNSKLINSSDFLRNLFHWIKNSNMLCSQRTWERNGFLKRLNGKIGRRREFLKKQEFLSETEETLTSWQNR